MDRQRLIIGVSGSSAPHLAWATLKALHNHAEVETHLVVSRGADKTIELEMGAKRDDFEALADVYYDPAPNDITAQLRSQVQKIEIEAELIELDELGALIPVLEPTPESGSAAERAAAAIETVITAYSHTALDDRDHQAIDTIAHAATRQVSH